MIAALDGNVALGRRAGAPELEDPLELLRRACLTANRPASEPLLSLLASDLHDGAVQDLFAAELDVAELRARSDLDPDVAALVHNIAQRLADSTRHLRAVLHDLTLGERTDSTDLPLDEAIHGCVESFIRRNPLSIDVEIRGPEAEIGPQQHRTALRLVREGLTNIGKHASASQALVSVYRSRQWFTLDLDDDGCGDPVQIRCRMAQEAARSFGLPSLASQATTAGGRVWVSSSPTLGGVRISLALPTRTVAWAPTTPRSHGAEAVVDSAGPGAQGETDALMDEPGSPSRRRPPTTVPQRGTGFDKTMRVGYTSTWSSWNVQR